MKYLLLLPLTAVVFFTNSCRTQVPVNPMTMKQSDCCMPSHFQAPGPASCDDKVVRSSK